MGPQGLRMKRAKAAKEDMAEWKRAMGMGCVMGVVITVLAISIQWTGYGGDNQWTNRINWSPDQVPTINDDVTIASGNVQVTIATGANSIVMGTSFSAPANLTVFNSFFLGSGGLSVDGNGNLMINSGAASVSGNVQIGGALYFQSGQIGGQWTVNSRGVADLSGAAQKVLSGCQLSVAGSLTLSGVLALNQSSQVVVTSSAVLSGMVSIQSQDTTQVLFDTSAGSLTYNGGGTFQIQAPMKLGKFKYVAGNISIYNDIAFAGNLTIPSGSVVSTVGSASVQLSDGLAGSGMLSAAGASLNVGASTYGGVIEAVAGNVTFSGASSVAVLSVSGATVKGSGKLHAGKLSLKAGTIGGTVQATNATLNSPGFGLNGQLEIAQRLETVGNSLFSFGAQGGLSIMSGATLDVGGPLTLAGAPGPSVVNDGTINVNYATAIQNVNLVGSGSVNAVDALKMTAATVKQNKVRLESSGSFGGTATQITLINAVVGKPSVVASIGKYRFTCPGECDNLRTSGLPSSDFTFTIGA